MKFISALCLLSLTACAQMPQERIDARNEADRAAHEHYLESVYNLDNYDPEYVSDCLYYADMVCEFE